MLSDAQLKKIQSLKLKKYRQKYSEFLIEGDKLVLEALQLKTNLQHVVATRNWITNHSSLFSADISLIEALPHQIKKISALSTAPEVIAVIKIPNSLNNVEKNSGWILALDNINDPGNLGTIIRTAEWFGITTILCSEECVDCYNGKTVQASMGSVLRMHIIYTNLKEKILELQLPVYAACLNGESSTKISFPTTGILIIGSESHGISEALLQISNYTITIPGTGNSESLNAAVACGILLAEINR